MQVETFIGEIWIYKVPFVDGKGSKPRPVIIISAPNSKGDVRGIPGSSKIEQWNEPYQQLVATGDLENGHLDYATLFPVSKQMVFCPKCFAARVGKLKKKVLESVLRKVSAQQVECFVEGVKVPDSFIPGESVIPPSGKVIGAPEI